MQDMDCVTGIILKAEPIGEYDRRLVILTKEKGKISAFAKGARRPNSKLIAATNPFCYGIFYIYAGRNSYTIRDITIKDYFEALRTDYIAAYYGIYFLEIADYYGRENNDDIQMLNLLYLALKALIHNAYDNKLVMAIYEIKIIVVNGEFPGYFKELSSKESILHAIQFIVETPLNKLFSFAVEAQILRELLKYSRNYQKQCIAKNFKTLEILKTLA